MVSFLNEKITKIKVILNTVVITDIKYKNVCT